MTSRYVVLLICMLAILMTVILIGAENHTTKDQTPALIAHEWGTFTSIAAKSGDAMEWMPYGGPSDLPCFVDRFDGVIPKVNMFGTIRMETPVIYFYSPRATTVNVRVDFRQGWLTEWFPPAKTASPSLPSTLIWSNVRVDPNGTDDFPVEHQPSHYYASRNTDASPLQVATDKEKFVFYRGVGRSPLPIAATITSGGLVKVRNTGRHEIRGVVLFENRNGKVGFRIHPVLYDEAILEPPSLTVELLGLIREFKTILTKEGLYTKEAQAMIDAWRESWFEQGSRVFYIVPQRDVDSMLPLEIQPAPVETRRVFVGRMEIITPATEREIRTSVATHDRAALEQYGRFLQPISAELQVSSPLLQSIRQSYVAQASGCGRTHQK